MKIVARLFIVISLILGVFVILSLLNSYVSWKYMVEEPMDMGRVDETVLQAKHTIGSDILVCWTVLSYIILSVVVCQQLLRRIK